MAGYVTEVSLYCKGCNLAFKAQRDLDIHVITCTRPARGTSFFQYTDLRGGMAGEKTEIAGEKIALPDSQISSQNTEENREQKAAEEKNHSCHLCGRNFGSGKGLQVHLRSCMTKGSVKRKQGQVVEEIERQQPQASISIEGNLNQNQPLWEGHPEGHTYADLEQMVSAMYDEIE